MIPRFTLRHALSDPALLGATLAGDSWAAWRTLLIAAMGEPLTDTERETFTKLTAREREPGQRIEELWAVIGRRGGKSRAMATLATYIAGLCDHRDKLAPGERGVLLCIAPDQRQASITLDYASAAFEATPILSQLIATRNADALELTNGISMEVRAASFRRLRGPTYIAVIADEAAFWYADEFSANADGEILNAVRPGLATTRGPLIVASSPYARRGELWSAHRKHYGAAGDPLILVAQGASRDFNPSLPQSVVDRAMERDPASAAAEYLARFRSDVEAFVSREAVEMCVSPGVIERAPISRISYSAFCDPAGGAGADSFTLAIAHAEDGVAILDCLRECRPPFSPRGVVAEFAELLKRYRVSTVRGDRYAGDWPAEAFREHQINYVASDRNRSQIYGNILAEINSRKVDLLDNARLTAQLISLERKTGRGRDTIDHPPGGHDDLANAAAGALTEIVSVRRPFIGLFDMYDRSEPARPRTRVEYKDRADGLGREPIVVSF